MTKLEDARSPIFRVLSWYVFGNDICRLQLILTDRAMEKVKISGLQRIFRNPHLTVGPYVFTDEDMRIIPDENVLSLHVTLTREELENITQPLRLTLRWEGFGERKLNHDPS
ncbi:hypothetical protein KKC88_02180 [Patescibacteria group bacterium]|nr:hypothetical protein [Patescibacteria group bacterium]MBU1673115.1 hypothetical protein [Patescibacteria group bacterium]MBU1963793.1 hypothetical protein [Patescibacteria group bacterium]